MIVRLFEKIDVGVVSNVSYRSCDLGKKRRVMRKISPRNIFLICLLCGFGYFIWCLCAGLSIWEKLLVEFSVPLLMGGTGTHKML